MRCRKQSVALRMAQGHNTFIVYNVWSKMWTVSYPHVSLHYVNGLQYFIFQPILYFNDI